MCVTEIWTYRDCGCRYNYLVSCHPFFDRNTSMAYEDYDEDKENIRSNEYDQNSGGGQDHSNDVSSCFSSAASSLSKSDCYTKQSDYYNDTDDRKPQYGKRQCSVHHTVDREFLEPVCDECVVEEAMAGSVVELTLDKTHRNNCYLEANGAIMVNGIDEDGTLILESNVEIEIVPERFSEDLTEDIKACTVRTVRQDECDGIEAIQDSRGGIGQTPPSISVSSDVASSTKSLPYDDIHDDIHDDADDELSLYTSSPFNADKSRRGRLRTRSKELRRRGMDISREELRLRIVSGWSSGEKESMEEFRRVLKGERPRDATALGREVERGRAGMRTWAQGLASRVGRSLGRGSRGRKEAGQSPTFEGGKAGADAVTVPEALAGGVSSSSVNTVFEHGDSRRESQTLSSAETEEMQAAAFTARSSWEQHLKQDLGKRYRSSSMDVEQHRNEPFQPSKTDLYLEDESDLRRRLLSASSAVPSIPATASCSGSNADSWPRTAEPLSFSSGEFEHSWTETPLGEWHTYGSECASETLDGVGSKIGDGDVTSIDDHTSIATESLHGRTESIDSITSFQSELSTFTSTTKPRDIRIQTQNQSSGIIGLSIHPLTAPLRLATPVRQYPAPERSSSMFSPPASSPYWLYAETSTMRQSPTRASVCVREAVVCGWTKSGFNGRRAGVCGNPAGERMISCVCDTNGMTEDRCRAQKVVVRQVLGEKNAGEICDECAGRDREHT